MRRTKEALRQAGVTESQVVSKENLERFNQQHIETALSLPAVIEEPEDCALCGTHLKPRDIKISKRMANYAKDQGGERYRRLVHKVFEAAELTKQ
jgi:hypothetical protein